MSFAELGAPHILSRTGILQVDSLKAPANTEAPSRAPESLLDAALLEPQLASIQPSPGIASANVGRHESSVAPPEFSAAKTLAFYGKIESYVPHHMGISFE